MRKPLMFGLVLGSLLSGCTVPVTIAPQVPDTEGVVTGGLTAKKLPAGTKTVGPRAPMPQRPNMTPPKQVPLLSNRTSALGVASGSADAASAPVPHLKLADDQEPSLKLVPMYDDNDQLTAVMASPSDGTLSWRVQAAGGPVQLKTVKLTLRREAIAQPTPSASAAPATAPPPSPQGEPMSFEKPAADLGLPDTASVGTGCTLKLSLKGEEGKKFLLANANASRASVTITLLDGSGNPVPGDDGAPLTLKASISVL